MILTEEYEQSMDFWQESFDALPKPAAQKQNSRRKLEKYEETLAFRGGQCYSWYQSGPLFGPVKQSAAPRRTRCTGTG